MVEDHEEKDVTMETAPMSEDNTEKDEEAKAPLVEDSGHVFSPEPEPMDSSQPTSKERKASAKEKPEKPGKPDKKKEKKEKSKKKKKKEKPERERKDKKSKKNRTTKGIAAWPTSFRPTSVWLCFRRRNFETDRTRSEQIMIIMLGASCERKAMWTGCIFLCKKRFTR